jgi:cytochrome c oxidase assembly protein subunit 11
MANSTDKKADTRSLVLKLLGISAGAFVFGVFAMPPLYDVICEVTGLGGKTNASAASIDEIAAAEDVSERVIRLEFDTTVNQYAPWTFESDRDSMEIHPGGIYEATFTATNLTDREMIAQAVPSVAPMQAAKYFKKLECFCFTTQEFSPHEEKQMPVRFIVESDLPEFIDTITLSYTFFDTQRMSENAGQGDHSAHSTH